MSQNIWTAINPETTTGLMLSALLDDFKDALMTGCAGLSRPSALAAGGMWIDTTSQAAPDYYWSFMFYDGSVDTEIFRISILNGIGGTLTANATFTAQEIAADAVGPILDLVKNRIATNGQVLSGDTVMQIKFVGRTNTSTDPTVAYFKFTASDDNTSAASGGTFTMYSTPDASATITEHLKLIDGYVESVTPHKITSLQPVSQNVATTATIAQLSASKQVAEMTGSTATDIQGINSAHDSKVVTIHNRSTATVTLKHLNSSAAAADRIKLPRSSDYAIIAGASATLFYCTTDTYWKLRSVSGKRLYNTVETLDGAYQQWTCPAGVTRVTVNSNRDISKSFGAAQFIDPYGNMYCWGDNANGQIGIGDVTARSSPVAVIGGVTFDYLATLRTMGPRNFTVAISKEGTAYAWGVNSFGYLGTNDGNPRSSPVAVVGGWKFSGFTSVIFNAVYAFAQNGDLYAWGIGTVGEMGDGARNTRTSPVKVSGGLKFSRVIGAGTTNNQSVCGITRTGVAYAWGQNTNGELGVGDVTDRSSPVAVLGGLTFKKIVTGGGFYVGITTAGVTYAWGINTYGQLGTGDVVSRSSPVAVLGGLTFVDVFASPLASFGLTATGQLYGWGYNTTPVLGVGDFVDRSSPVAVLGGLTFKKVFASASETRALTEDGTLYAWGTNPAGLLGVGGSDLDSYRSSPIAVLGGLKFSAVNTDNGFNTIFGLTTSGVMYAWGANTKGILGVGDSADRSSPVAVLGSTNMIGGMGPFRQTCMTVVPGTVYDVVLSQGQSQFGATPIGNNVDSITIEYEN